MFGAESFYEELSSMSKDTAWGTVVEKAQEQKTKLGERLTGRREKSENVGMWDIEGMPRLGQ